MNGIIAKELMLGNLVKTPRGIKSICEIGFKPTSETERDYYGRFDDLHEGYFFSSCEAVPITDEILAKCRGFKKAQLSVWEYKDLIEISLWKDENEEDEAEKEGLMVWLYPTVSREVKHIKYLHQLQNLIFIIDNYTELKISKLK